MRGILFKPNMIKAIINGSKVMTRRVIKPQPEDKDGNMILIEGRWKYNYSVIGEYARYHAGETVYIKEAYSTYGYPEVPFYKDEPNIDIKAIAWHSPMMMPERYARYFIKITDVKAERLQEIDIRDIHAEGVRLPEDKVGYYGKLYVDAFHNLWNSINKPPHDWNGNPYVFVYSFERMEDK